MSSVLSCPDCGSPHAFDQRYCTECGRRVRPLPHTVAITLAAMAGERRVGADRLNSTAAQAGGASTPTPTSGRSLLLFGSPIELPSPRALMVGVLAVLAFGVIISSGNFGLASSPLLLNVHRLEALAASAPPPTAPSNVTANSNSAPTASPSASPATSSASSGSTPAATGTAPSGTASTPAPASSAGLPPIKHVWVIELGDQGYASTFDRGSPDPYLSTTLAKQGEVVPQVFASATSDLANEVGLISGQGPTVQTEADCPSYTALKPGTLVGKQVKGEGCVYPKSTPSMLSELTAAHDTWKAYVQGLGSTAAAGCRHPGVGAKDPNFRAKTANSYVTWRNPVVFLAGQTSLKSCGSDDTGLSSLTANLKTVATTPNVSYIFPNPCDDGSDTPCHAGAAAGTAQSDRFLKSIVPQITASAAYKQDGMILITFAQSPQNVATPDQGSCCDQPTKYPNLPSANYEPPMPGAESTTPQTGTATDTSGTTTAGTSTAGTSTTGTSTTGTGPATTSTGKSASDTGGAPTATTAASPYQEDTVTGGPALTTAPAATPTPPAPTASGAATTCVPTPAGTTTAPDTTTTATGTATTGTDTTPDAETCVCPTTTSTATSTTSTDTSTTTTTGTETTPAEETCVCPAGTSTAMTGTDTTTTSTTTQTDTTPSGGICVCPSPADTTTTATSTDTTPTQTGSTPSTGDVVECVPPAPATSGPTGGGGQVGMLVLSQYVTKNLQDGVDMFNTFSITASLEQLFGLKYTGYAATPGLPLFSGFLYSNYTG